MRAEGEDRRRDREIFPKRTEGEDLRSTSKGHFDRSRKREKLLQKAGTAGAIAVAGRKDVGKGGDRKRKRRGNGPRNLPYGDFGK